MPLWLFKINILHRNRIWDVKLAANTICLNRHDGVRKCLADGSLRSGIAPSKRSFRGPGGVGRD